MAIRALEHVGIVVDDLAAATEFFVELGLKADADSTGSVEGTWVDRIIGLEGVRADIAFVGTPDGESWLELTKFHSPPAENGGGPAPANAYGIRHISFSVDDIDATVARLRARGVEFVGEVVQYKEAYRLCYVRGPAGIIVELAEKLG